MRIEHTVHIELKQKYNKLVAFVESLTMDEFSEDHLNSAAKMNAVSVEDEVPASIALRARQVLEECKGE